MSCTNLLKTLILEQNYSRNIGFPLLEHEENCCRDIRRVLERDSVGIDSVM